MEPPGRPFQEDSNFGDFGPILDHFEPFLSIYPYSSPFQFSLLFLWRLFALPSQEQAQLLGNQRSERTSAKEPGYPNKA